jgi:hypothetical protein
VANDGDEPSDSTGNTPVLQIVSYPTALDAAGEVVWADDPAITNADRFAGIGCSERMMRNSQYLWIGFLGGLCGGFL